MHYVILRDDDTNALTPPECLEMLYRPWLERGLAVNLATIPAVRTDAHRRDGRPEGFLFFGAKGPAASSVPIGRSARLTDYLLAHRGYRIVQHGYDHSLGEFGSHDQGKLGRRLDDGARLLVAAGFPRTEAFVAPYDRFSRAGLQAAAGRFRIVSGGWFDLRRVPLAWWPAYLWKKACGQPHWRVGRTILLSHPGCILARGRPCHEMLARLKQAVARQRVTVLVTHWWEYFPGGIPDRGLIDVLHRAARWLADDPGIRVISFAELTAGNVPLN